MTAETNAVRPKRRHLAYSVHDGDEGWDIVFAHRAASAAVLGANALDCDKEEVEVERLKWADQYYPNAVPWLTRIEYGWHIECRGCDILIGAGEIAYHPETDEEITLDPVEDSRGPFCTAACRDGYDQEIIERRGAEYVAIANLAEVFRAKFPDLEILDKPHAYVQRDDETREWQAGQVILSFDFPGRKIAPGTFRFDKPGEEPQVWICAGDKAAWDAWRASLEVVHGA